MNHLTSTLLVFFALFAQLCYGGACARIDTVTLQVHTPQIYAQSAGYIAAENLGYYRDVCLNVLITTAPNGDEVIQSVLNGTSHFGTHRTFSVLNHTEGNALVIIAQVFQNPGFRLMWQKHDTFGTELCNINNMSVGIERDFNLPLRAFFLSCNKDEQSVLEVSNPLISNPMSWAADILSGTTYDQYASLLSTFSPDNLELVSPEDYVLYSDPARALLEDSIIVSRGWLNTGGNPDVIKRFIEAVFRGWVYCRDQEQQCASWLSSGTTPVAQFQMREVNRLIWPSANGIGFMDTSKYQQTARTLSALNAYRNFTNNIEFPYDITYAQQALLTITTGGIDVTGIHYNQSSLALCNDGAIISTCESTPNTTEPSHSKKEKSLSLSTIILIVIPGCVALSVISAVGLFILWRKKANVRPFGNDETNGGAGYYIDFNELTVEAKIGSGSFGDVYKGTWRDTPVAVKRLRRNITDQLDELKREAVIMLQLRHPHIVLFMGCCPDPPNICIVTEFMPKGSLFDVLHDERVDLPWERRLSMAKDTAKGLTFLHCSDPPTLHNDLKSPNLLVSHNWLCKVSDFGLTSLKGSRTQDELLGSIYWMAPEVLNNEPATEKSDVYSFGIILWELAARAEPYEGMSWAAVRVGVLRRKQRPIMPKNLDPDYAQLIRDCWNHEPSLRPSFPRILKRLEEMSLNLQKQSFPHPPPIGKVTIVFSDIQNSAFLWENCPNEMKEAMAIHNEIIRRTFREYKGYEVRSDGDSFMIAFASAKDACAFSVKVTETLLLTQWNPELLAWLEDEGRGSGEGGGYEEVVFKGVRVRMGMHHADCQFTRDPVTDRVDYTGPTPAKAARLSIAAQGGQILVSSSFYDEICNELHTISTPPPAIMPVGTIYLKGFPDPELVYQVLAPSLIGRHKKYMAQPSNNSTVIWQDQTNNLDSILFSHNLNNTHPPRSANRNVTLTAYPQDLASASPRYRQRGRERDTPGGPSPSPTPSPTPSDFTATPNPSATPSPLPSAEPSPVPSAEPSPVPSGEPSPVPSPKSGNRTPISHLRNISGKTPRNIEQNQFNIDFNEITLGEAIGHGSYGVVMKGKWRGQNVAVKKLLRGKVKQEILTEFYHEVQIMCNLRCPNLILFMGACFKPPNLCIVTELMPRNLFQVLHDPKLAVTSKMRLKWAKDIALGMNYLHKENIIHRDLKSNNLLVDASWNVKITDFGFARVKSTNQTMTKCGTVNWIAPEIALGKSYTEKSDVYSYAVTLYEILTRQVPFANINANDVLELIMEGGRPVPAPNSPRKFVRLMAQCWDQDYEKRPSFEEIVNTLDTWTDRDCDFE